MGDSGLDKNKPYKFSSNLDSKSNENRRAEPTLDFECSGHGHSDDIFGKDPMRSDQNFTKFSYGKNEDSKPEKSSDQNAQKNSHGPEEQKENPKKNSGDKKNKDENSHGEESSCSFKDDDDDDSSIDSDASTPRCLKAHTHKDGRHHKGGHKKTGKKSHHHDEKDKHEEKPE